MTPTISSELVFTAEDYLLYLRCPRSAHLSLTGELPVSEPGFPVPSDRDEVRELAFARTYPEPCEFSRTIAARPFAAVVDVWHRQRPEGSASVIIREATGLKEAYLIEQVFIRYCAEKSGELPARQFVHHLNKSYSLSGPIDPDALFISADVTRRVKLMYDEHRKRLDALAEELASDPSLEFHRNRPCARAHACPACSADVRPVGDNHITTLHRGGDLIAKLMSEGFTNITDIPEDLLAHRRQRIQKAALQSLKPQVDRVALDRFLDSVSYPLHYLDFEAVNSAIPRYEGAKPWEHVPYLFSVHTEPEPDADLRHTSFLMNPPHDQRRELLDALFHAIAGGGTVLVYGAAFEAGVLARLAKVYPECSEAIRDVIGRIVDLLEPFREFSYYDHRQRGKVSLKTVLPVLTDRDYSGLTVKNGYTANLAYRFLEATASANGEARIPDPGDLADSLVRYCTMDTLAMVSIMASLRSLVEEAGS